MKIELDDKNRIVLKKVYSGILLETSEGNRLGICMRDDTFEINVMPKGAVEHNWQRVNMKTGNITRMFKEVENSEPSDGQG